jgi:hypothetical protein
MGMTSGKQGLSIGNELSDPDGYSLDNQLTFIEFHKPNDGNESLLLQTGDYVLLQAGGKITLEAA